MSLEFVGCPISAGGYTLSRREPGPRPVGCRCGSEGLGTSGMKTEYGSLSDTEGVRLPKPFAAVACMWHQADPVEPQFPYWYRKRYCAAFYKYAIMNSTRERHMFPTHPQQQ